MSILQVILDKMNEKVMVSITQVLTVSGADTDNYFCNYDSLFSLNYSLK